MTPVFLSLLIGIMELGMAMNDYLGMGAAARSGARVASATGNDLYADYSIVQRVSKDSSAIKRSAILFVVVYKPSAIGEAPSATCQTGSPSAGSGAALTGACNVYVTSDFLRPKSDFGCLSTSPDRYWCPTVRNVAKGGSGSDYIGVWMKVRHTWVTKMFGNAKDLTDSSVIRLEPRTK
ncbi:MAG: hypothetical protein JWN46_2093 [Acidimicrobiales bacterium]|nr:hypothetical protein [Acidimicrobiales bacterium]